MNKNLLIFNTLKKLLHITHYDELLICINREAERLNREEELNFDRELWLDYMYAKKEFPDNLLELLLSAIDENDREAEKIIAFEEIFKHEKEIRQLETELQKAKHRLIKSKTEYQKLEEKMVSK